MSRHDAGVTACNWALGIGAATAFVTLLAQVLKPFAPPAVVWSIVVVGLMPPILLCVSPVGAAVKVAPDVTVRVRSQDAALWKLICQRGLLDGAEHVQLWLLEAERAKMSLLEETIRVAKSTGEKDVAVDATERLDRLRWSVAEQATKLAAKLGAPGAVDGTAARLLDSIPG